MPPLAQTLATSKKASAKGSSINDGNMKNEKFMDLENMTSKIDKLDSKINESTLKISRLRKKSLDILTDGDESGNNDEDGGTLSFLSVEKEINRLQEHKNTLVGTREILISNLQSKLIDQLTDTPVIVSSAESTIVPVLDTSQASEVMLE